MRSRAAPPGQALKRGVLIVVENLPVPFDRRVWMEATALRDAGYLVSVICPTGKGYEARREMIEDIAVYRHPLPPESNAGLGFVREYLAALWHETRLAWRVRRERGFDVLHACNPPDLIFLVTAPFKLLYGTRFVFDQHDVNPELYLTKFGRRDLPYRALVLAERLTYALADVVISTNESYRKIALTRGHKRPDQVFVVRSAPSLERFRPRPGGERHREGFRYLVGYLGVMGPQEGVDYLLHAVRHMVDRGRRDVKVMLIGGGSSLADLRALAEELGIGAYVEFTGRVPDEELLERLSACDVCVNPDPLNPLNDVSSMNKIVEYMALGKPIVQFDLKEGRASAGEASVYARPNDARALADELLALLDDPERRAAMGDAGLQRMREQLAWEHQVPALRAAYARALGTVRLSPPARFGSAERF
ncbi:glycosyltransferase family 4 protein [Deinococcus metallilatus]|uniref:Glycosyltransferase involved in cell wall biosynthesis n=1 Tax=Deinococcus metallilatus TaxID=1211322 RepID=A0ABR6MXX7_9DEIO|nr:glycosyltransferase family 4 protein [Deinococcus metallilatus]MBB5296803.1 glycosyltransferase involved in cell wall biosynthesis [Deinococcus metallilatus]GMA13835.1 glycosyltransferase WbuB [Deinococcus metallilatus]